MGGQKPLIVADSSYVVEGLLKNKNMLAEDNMVAPDLVLYEVANALWKHEHILKDLENGKPYLSIFYDLIAVGKITVIFPSESLMHKSYTIAKENGITIYDALFISLAIELGIKLRTLDTAQERVFKK